MDFRSADTLGEILLERSHGKNESGVSFADSSEATQGSQAILSEVFSELEMAELERTLLATRMKKFMEATRPGLIWANEKLDMLQAADHADKLLGTVDMGLQQIQLARNELNRLDLTNSKMSLIDGWVWILAEGIRELQTENIPAHTLVEHFSGKITELLMDSNQICRILMTVSINCRVARNILSYMIQSHRGKFRGGVDTSIMAQGIKPDPWASFNRLSSAKKVRSLHSKISNDGNFTALGWTPDFGLALKDAETGSSVTFRRLEDNQKLALLNFFFDEVRTTVIQPAFAVLCEMKQLLPSFRSTAKSFGDRVTLRVKPTRNAMEKQIMKINVLLEKSDTEYWDHTLSLVFLEYLNDIRIRMLNIVHDAEAVSSELEKVESKLRKIDINMKRILRGNYPTFQESLEDISSVVFPIPTVDLASVVHKDPGEVLDTQIQINPRSKTDTLGSWDK